MKRQNEFAVGLSVLVAVVLVVAGAIWLSETRIGADELVHVARFRTVGGLGVGAPVALRGVKVGRVEAIRLADGDWVEADLRVDLGVELPVQPAVIAASASLFGEWRALIVPLETASDDPGVRAALAAAAAPGDDRWPGVTLPDVGQLTAEASRIASDVGLITARVGGAFDSTAVANVRGSLEALRTAADRLAEFATRQNANLNRITDNVAGSSDVLAGAATHLDATLGRADSATADGQLTDIMNSARTTGRNVSVATEDLKELTGTMRRNQESIVRILQGLDSLMSRMERGEGTLNLLATDSTLYRETTRTIVQLRELMSDIQANPRKYFKFSVF